MVIGDGVEKLPRTNGKEISEDDGYLICLVHDEKSG
jgi:hypothetical protein